MRLSVRDIGFKVSAAPETVGPIRLRLAGLTYAMSISEARELATALADTIIELKTHDRRTP